ncbi:NAD(P)/FAD-dependent oxidoreductase [Janibacter sp. GXQ6167]|uniref:NAD(P)/FAD-dependent oxidoreductase n=1 Tax=Janibacter sp. GXQ6167 TaxID=3240791 RepID=UPI003525B1B6
MDGQATAPLWSDDAAPAGDEVDALPRRADLVIVGAGFTGLWTAYHYLRRRPDAHVVILEAERVGFGASGRNGGWASALYPVGASVLARRYGAPAARAMGTHLRASVDAIGEIARAEGIECDYIKGGTISLARSPAQVARARDEVASHQAWGGRSIWFDREAAQARIQASRVLGASFDPDCARLHPRRLVDGLARVVRARGGQIIEGTPVAGASPGTVVVAGGHTIRARQIVRATEAWTARLPSLRRRIAPVYSLMVATEPLAPALWEEIGLAKRETFSDHRHVIIYGQRTPDDRIAFGGRGAPYHPFSGISPAFDHDPRVFAALRATLRSLLPQLASVAFTHAWGGPLGIARDWHPSVGYDSGAGVGWAGGYVGDGVAASQLAGRTLADLLVGEPSERTELPWIGHHSPSWEPEPLRWAGINLGLKAAEWADREEERTGKPALLGRALGALTGH